MRRHNDFYETSAYAVTELIRNVRLDGDVLFECCVGTGAISKPLSICFPDKKIFTNDIDKMLPASQHFDAANPANWANYTLPAPNETIDWTITNPPFNSAFKILINAYDNSTKGVAFLLRLSFLEPTYERQHWLSDHPPNKLIVLPRFSFTGDGKTDSVTCAWMVWEKSMPWKKDNSILISKK